MTHRRIALLIALLLLGLPLAAQAACTNTTNLALCKPAAGDTGWDTSLNSNFDVIDTALPMSFESGSAAGDGVTDDSDELQAVLTAAAGKSISCPSGKVYAFNTTLTIPGNAHLMGAHPVNNTAAAGTAITAYCTLKYTGVGTALQFSGSGVTIQNIYLTTSTGATGIDTNTKNTYKIYDNGVVGFSTAGITVDTWAGRIARNSFNSNAIDIKVTGAGNQTVIEGNHFYSNGTTAIQLASATASTGGSITNNQFSSQTTTDYVITVSGTGSTSWSITKNRTEAGDASGFLIIPDGNFGFSVIGNQIEAPSGSPATTLISVAGGGHFIAGNQMSNATNGIVLDSTARRVTVIGNDVVTAVTNAVVDGASAANKPTNFLMHGGVLLGAEITAGSGTGVTVNAAGSLASVVYKVTVSYTNCITNGLTCDLTIATMPAKTLLKAVFADLTTTYACADTCTTSTLSGTLGTAAGGTQLLASFDLDSAAAQFGDADAELGASINAAARAASGALFEGVLMSWSATTPVSFRITSGTGNLGDGAATNLSQGSITFYLVTLRLP